MKITNKSKIENSQLYSCVLANKINTENTLFTFALIQYNLYFNLKILQFFSKIINSINGENTPPTHSFKCIY